jgi:hypothetical protein
MTEDLKKPQPDDVTGHMLLEYSREDYLDSGMEPGERGAPISIGEAERAVEMYFFDYEEFYHSPWEPCPIHKVCFKGEEKIIKFFKREIAKK